MLGYSAAAKEDEDFDASYIYCIVFLKLDYRSFNKEKPF